MTPEIERLAIKVVGDYSSDAVWPFSTEEISQFAALVVELCAKECESQLADGECPERAQYCADAIRAKFARGHKTPEAK